MKGGLFDVHSPHIGGPFQGLGEALAAVERHRASLARTPAAEASSSPLPDDEEEDWMKEQREKGRALKLYL